MYAGVKSAWTSPGGLAHSDAAHTAGHHHYAHGEYDWQPASEKRPFGSCPVQVRFCRHLFRSYMDPPLAVVLDDLIKIVQRNGCGPSQEAPAGDHQQILQEQHLKPPRLGGLRDLEERLVIGQFGNRVIENRRPLCSSITQLPDYPITNLSRDLALTTAVPRRH